MATMTDSLVLQKAQYYMRRSRRGSSGSIRVKSSGLPHFEQGSRSLSLGVSAIPPSIEPSGSKIPRSPIEAKYGAVIG
jgi:hypothetical protein